MFFFANLKFFPTSFRIQTSKPSRLIVTLVLQLMFVWNRFVSVFSAIKETVHNYLGHLETFLGTSKAVRIGIIFTFLDEWATTCLLHFLLNTIYRLKTHVSNTAMFSRVFLYCRDHFVGWRTDKVNKRLIAQNIASMH